VLLQFICRTGFPTGFWGRRLLRRPSLVAGLDVEHIRIFGCLTYSHVPSEKRTKLDPTAQQGILVGYSKVSKAYHIYIPSQQRVVVSRDVRFEEGRYFQEDSQFERQW
jgi:hypothetical protein